ncbi:MAG TPA: caspase family protein [Thermoanaerobaculia bacterium]|nr:caspase family protein [Thermoanaerobaculia bacterium]
MPSPNALPSDDLARGGEEITPEMLEALAPHVVNLNQGRFSVSGRLRTRKADVDRIFDEHLPRALQQAAEEGGPLNLVFYAHGGLVNESGGILRAHNHVAWWRANGVYPIYFIWETGLVEQIRQFFFPGPRDLATRGLLDPVIEAAVRAPGGAVWAKMKLSALQSVDAPPAPPGGGEPQPEKGGGARYVAQRLARFCEENAGQVVLHAVGHSAGAIFHAHFLPTAFSLGVPAFRSVHFLAPAITVEEFHRRLAGHVQPDEIERLTIFTMKRSFELADTCGFVYRKSLLYLIHHALEPEPRTAILGLQDSLFDDDELRRIFALDGQPVDRGEVVWSVTDAASGRNATQSKKHGGFDDDPPTMNSVLRRVIGLSDTAALQKEFPRPRAVGPAADPWLAPAETPSDLASLVVSALSVSGAPVSGAGVSAPVPASGVTPVSQTPVVTGGGAGRRRALCIGIDRYPTAPLAGCVADARLWSQTLAALGFEPPEVLLDGQADRAGILRSLGSLVDEGRPGDVLVFQFAGHGTQLDDLNSDEDDSKDEAICAFDFADGAFVIDDDLAEVFGRLRDGVNLTCFIDCCHSGTITRVAAGLPGGPPADPTARRRFVVASRELQEAHAQFRRGLGDSRSATREQSQMREVTFSACQPFEVAWEVQGQGEFTRHANRILSAGIQGVSHSEFQRRVEEAFGPTGRQHPFLHCPPGAETRPLLQALAGDVSAGGREAAGPPDSLAVFLRSIADLMTSR